MLNMVPMYNTYLPFNMGLNSLNLSTGFGLNTTPNPFLFDFNNTSTAQNPFRLNFSTTPYKNPINFNFVFPKISCNFAFASIGTTGTTSTPLTTSEGNTSSSDTSNTTEQVGSSVLEGVTGQKIQKNNSQYGEAFLNKVKQVANNLHCNYRDLLAIMNSESGINANLLSKNKDYGGLIMFNKEYVNRGALGKGITFDQVISASPIKQLDYVEIYFKRAKQMAKIPDSQTLSSGQLYALAYLPGRAGRYDLCYSTETGKERHYYWDNKQLDANNDGKITRDEMGVRIRKFAVSDNSFLA